MANLAKLIFGQNSLIISESITKCNYPQQCPLNEIDLKKGVYQATVISSYGDKDNYSGLSATLFKDRLPNPKKFFKNEVTPMKLPRAPI